MSSTEPLFTLETLAQALTELGRMANEAGRVIDIALYGGSCLMLVSNFRVATRDVDAVASASQDFIDQAARSIAERHGWPMDWLNDGVRAYLSPRVDGLDQHSLFRTYPSEETPGLRVFVPTPEYMLAMKLIALRIDPASEYKDLDDILNLMDVVRLGRKEDLIGFAVRFYPEARTSAKLLLSVDALWAEHIRRQQGYDHEPPRYLGRSRPPG